MAPFFHWHVGHLRPHGGRRYSDRGYRRDWDRWHRPEEPGPDPSPGPSPGPDLLQSVVSAATAPITAPLKAIGGLFGLEVEDPLPLADEEAEMYPIRHRRPRWARYQSGDENSESGDEFAPTREETPQLTNSRTRWPWLQREEQVWQDNAETEEGGGLGQYPATIPLEGELEEEWPDPPVDKDPVSGCITRGRPFDDFAFGSAAVPAKHGPRNQGTG